MGRRPAVPPPSRRPAVPSSRRPACHRYTAETAVAPREGEAPAGRGGSRRAGFHGVRSMFSARTAAFGHGVAVVGSQAAGRHSPGSARSATEWPSSVARGVSPWTRRTGPGQPAPAGATGPCVQGVRSMFSVRADPPGRVCRPKNGPDPDPWTLTPHPPRRLVPRLRPSRREGEDVANLTEDGCPPVVSSLALAKLAFRKLHPGTRPSLPSSPRPRPREISLPEAAPRYSAIAAMVTAASPSRN